MPAWGIVKLARIGFPACTALRKEAKAMPEGSIITDEMRATIGQEREPITIEVDKTAIRMFARAVGHTDLIFYDEEYAKSKGHRSIVCPPGFVGHAIHSPQQPSGITGSSVTRMPSLNMQIRGVLNGGTEFEYYGEDICAGDVLTGVSKMADLRERTGAMGQMLFVITETNYTNQDGKLVATQRGTAIMY
jgi:acyl dehydratase